MPTGYTADIAKGISFEDYALRCARAFGALVMLRDEPQDTPIPDDVSETSTYHTEGIEKAKNRLAELAKFSAEDMDIAASVVHVNDCERAAERRDENAELLRKYNTMLERAKAYVPPSENHTQYKEFMINQIQESIAFDCSDYPDPKKMTGEEWYENELKQANWDLKYHSTKQAESKHRDSERNLWVKQLKESLL